MKLRKRWVHAGEGRGGGGRGGSPPALYPKRICPFTKGFFVALHAPRPDWIHRYIVRSLVTGLPASRVADGQWSMEFVVSWFVHLGPGDKANAGLLRAHALVNVRRTLSWALQTGAVRRCVLGGVRWGDVGAGGGGDRVPVQLNARSEPALGVLVERDVDSARHRVYANPKVARLVHFLALEALCAAGLGNFHKNGLEQRDLDCS